MITDVDKKKQALVVTLSLSGKARETALEIDSSKLNADDGMDVLIKQLDAVFKRKPLMRPMMPILYLKVTRENQKKR